MLRRRATVYAFVGIGLLITAVFVSPTLGHSIVLATTKQPEPMTELYFSHHLELPATYITGQQQSFQFTIHNVSGREMAYSYRIVVNGLLVKPPQSLTMASGATRQITETLPIQVSTPRAEVEVQLFNLNQSIHYWTAQSKQ